jgi:hypothetical protein
VPGSSRHQLLPDILIPFELIPHQCLHNLESPTRPISRILDSVCDFCELLIGLGLVDLLSELGVIGTGGLVRCGYRRVQDALEVHPTRVVVVQKLEIAVEVVYGLLGFLFGLAHPRLKINSNQNQKSLGCSP